MNEPCRCCEFPTEFFDSDIVFSHEAKYYKCSDCGSIQIDNPNWLNEAYLEPIPLADSGLVFRSFNVSRLIALVLWLERKWGQPALDWGGGYGLLTRILRDLGFDFYNYDFYVDGILSPEFNLTTRELDNFRFDILCSIEVFEHLTKPLDTFSVMTQNSNLLIIGTQLIPRQIVKPSNRDWPYFQPTTGQHITFASQKGIRKFANKLGFVYQISIDSLHIFSKSKFRWRTRIILKNVVFRRFAMLLIYDLLIKARKSVVK